MSLALAAARAAVASEPPKPPAGCHWQEIPEIKVRLAVPDGWQFRGLPKKGGISAFEVIPAGPGIPSAPRSKYELRFQRLERLGSVVARAKEHVQNALATAATAEPLEEEKVGVVTLFSAVGQQSPDESGLPALTIAVAALANAKTGALYTIRFEIPAAELAAVQPMANVLFRAITIDDEI